jgi:hypothetical protein
MSQSPLFPFCSVEQEVVVMWPDCKAGQLLRARGHATDLTLTSLSECTGGGMVGRF